MRLSLSRIEAAHGELAPEFRATPQYECEPLSRTLKCSVILKVETTNPLRCFKGRGSQIAVEQAKRRAFQKVVCASAGNLGQAVAYCSRAANLESIVYASRKASPLKLKRIKELGADLRLVDGDIEVARRDAVAAAESEQAYLIEDSENIATCEGAATIGLELTDTVLGPLDAVLVALGGGAMATGVGYVIKNRTPATQVICVQPSGAPAMTLSWRQRRVVNTETINTIADGVAGRHPISEVLDDLLEVADDALLVEESSIIEGMRLLYHQAGLVAEPSAALGVAALLENRARFTGKRVALILCGSNVGPDDFRRWVTERE